MSFERSKSDEKWIAIIFVHVLHNHVLYCVINVPWNIILKTTQMLAKSVCFWPFETRVIHQIITILKLRKTQMLSIQITWKMLKKLHSHLNEFANWIQSNLTIIFSKYVPKYFDWMKIGTIWTISTPASIAKSSKPIERNVMKFDIVSYAFVINPM